MSEPSKRMVAALDTFKADMEKLGLGVSIQIGDGKKVVIVPEPAKDTTPDA